MQTAFYIGQIDGMQLSLVQKPVKIVITVKRCNNLEIVYNFPGLTKLSQEGKMHSEQSTIIFLSPFKNCNFFGFCY